MPGSPGRLIVLGGLTPAGTSASGVYSVRTGTGAARQIGALSAPLHDAAGVSSGGRSLVFGGGSPVTVGTVQAFPGAGTARVTGPLPAPRSDAAAVTIGGTDYVVGGYDGSMGLQPRHQAAAAGLLQVPVSHAAVTVSGSIAWIVGGESGGTVVSAVQVLRPDRAFGTAGAPGAGSPYFGAELLIADRGNNGLLLMDAAMHVVWRYPAPGLPRDPLRFYFPDDAFFTGHGTAIISNQEQNETIIKLGYPSGKITWSFGHPGHSGTAPGYLNEPDDAYLLKNGQVTVADAQNCRVLVINANRTVAHQIGTDGVCVHHPPASMGSPNGDTPLADGNLLVSEINGSWVSEYTPAGRLVWTSPSSVPRRAASHRGASGRRWSARSSRRWPARGPCPIPARSRGGTCRRAAAVRPRRCRGRCLRRSG